jgi:pimeloyl-ACP methyl ester carboxylesterase
MYTSLRPLSTAREMGLAGPSLIMPVIEGTLIEETLHPVRWAVIAALGIPCALALAFLAAKLVGHNDAGRIFLRFLRLTLGIEILVLVILALTGFLYEWRAESRDAILYHPPGRLMDVGGYRMHLSCAGIGGGPTVILEYGHQATYFDWALVQPEIAKFARVCFYDRAGYGWSDPSPRPRVPSVMAEELHTLLDAAGAKPPYILVGHSYGSFNATMFAHKFPDEVSGLVLVDGMNTFSLFPAPLRERISMRAMQFMIPFGLPRWRGWCGGGNVPEAMRGEKRAISCRAELYDTFYREREAYPESVFEMRTITSLGSVPLIVIPRDPTIGRLSTADTGWQRVQEQKMQLSTNAELVIATGSGHDVPLARPDVIVAAVRKLALTPRAPAGNRGTP